MKLRAWIATSISFHALLAALLTLPSSLLKSEPPPKIEVTIHERPRGNPKSKSKAQGKARTARLNGGIGKGLAQFRPNWSSLTQPGPNERRLIDPDARGTSEWPPDSWGAHQDGILKETEFFISYDRLFREIQGMLNYPSVLGKHAISGTLNVRLGFNDKSQCDWTRTTVGPANHYLKFYVMALIKKMCGMEFIGHLRFDTRTKADLNFDFKITDGLERTHDNAPDSIFGNTLMFRREWVKPIGTVEVGPITWSVFMPMGFVVDTTWFMQKWDEVMNHRDPLNDFRDPEERR